MKVHAECGGIRRGVSLALIGVGSAVLVACGGGDGGRVGFPFPGPGPGGPPETPHAVQLEVLSSRPEHVSGGDALIAARHTGSEAIAWRVNGADATVALAQDPDDPSRLIGLVTGLKLGDNLVEASAGEAVAQLALTNYPVTGPMLSGPHLSPFICQTQDFVLPDGSMLGAAEDADCSASTRVHYMYRSTADGALKPMVDTTSLPGDVAMTATASGATVPFVVRVETGTMNRGIYQNAILHDPVNDPPPGPASPPPGWNKRLLAVHGTGCVGGWYVQGAQLGISLLSGDSLTRLGEGYAIFNNTLNHPTNSCNAVLAGESALMGKEHFIETFGVPRYTISTGASGGAYTSLQLADAYPGLFDGVFINATYPDALAIANAGLDARLLSRYYLADNGAGFSESQIVAVSGHKNARAWYDLALQSGRTDPVPGRIDPIPPSDLPIFGGVPYQSAVWNAAVPVGLRYDPVANPTGARPTVFDVARNVYGINRATGFALRPFDNVGVQYGLEQLNAGLISTVQFLDLNEKIGGYDQDANYLPVRSEGDTGAILRAHQSGLHLNGNGGLASIPVFDISGIYDDDYFYHYQWFHFAVRERMTQANGDAHNHVMWRGGAPITAAIGAGGTPEELAVSALAASQGWQVFIDWMNAYKADGSASPQRDKVVGHKPAAATDGCFTRSTTPQFIAEAQTLSHEPDSQCNQLWPSYAFPRMQAGGPLAANKLKCALKPISAADYAVGLSEQELARLRAIFPTGVCDWTRPGIGQALTVPYASFGPAPANLVFDIAEP